MLINCDLGECDDLSLLAQQNHTIMPAINLANIACGGHRGNDKTMQLCIKHCLQYQVGIGAHPSYPDHANFGRISMAKSLSSQALHQSLVEQIEALMCCCQQQHTVLSHIKPHGALYHDCQNNLSINQMLGDIANDFNLPLILSITRHTNKDILSAFKQNSHLIWQEAFADRQYQEDGRLIPRDTSLKAVLTAQEIAWQWQCLSEKNSIKVGDKWLRLDFDTICFHSDNPASVAFLSQKKLEASSINDDL